MARRNMTIGVQRLVAAAAVLAVRLLMGVLTRKERHMELRMRWVSSILKKESNTTNSIWTAPRKQLK